jgi:hypothetical protein
MESASMAWTETSKFLEKEIEELAVRVPPKGARADRRGREAYRARRESGSGRKDGR